MAKKKILSDIEAQIMEEPEEKKYIRRMIPPLIPVPENSMVFRMFDVDELEGTEEEKRLFDVNDYWLAVEQGRKIPTFTSDVLALVLVLRRGRSTDWEFKSEIEGVVLDGYGEFMLTGDPYNGICIEPKRTRKRGKK